jgi:hypothetical protein
MSIPRVPAFLQSSKPLTLEAGDCCAKPGTEARNGPPVVVLASWSAVLALAARKKLVERLTLDTR